MGIQLTKMLELENTKEDSWRALRGGLLKIMNLMVEHAYMNPQAYKQKIFRDNEHSLELLIKAETNHLW